MGPCIIIPFFSQFTFSTLLLFMLLMNMAKIPLSPPYDERPQNCAPAYAYIATFKIANIRQVHIDFALFLLVPLCVTSRCSLLFPKKKILKTKQAGDMEEDVMTVEIRLDLWCCSRRHACRDEIFHRPQQPTIPRTIGPRHHGHHHHHHDRFRLFPAKMSFWNPI